MEVQLARSFDQIVTLAVSQSCLAPLIIRFGTKLLENAGTRATLHSRIRLGKTTQDHNDVSWLSLV
jgi:hypothetical protein